MSSEALLVFGITLGVFALYFLSHCLPERGRVESYLCRSGDVEP